MNICLKQNICRQVWIITAVLVLMPHHVCANNSNVFDLMDIDQKLNASLPMDALFTDEKGNQIELGQYFRGQPVLLSFIYFSCPQLCPMTLKSLTQSLNLLKGVPGKDYNVIAVSFAPEDSLEDGRELKEIFIGLLNKKGGADGIHFLRGNEDSVKAITNASGFRYVKDEASGLYAHPSLVIVATPQGKVSRYFFGPDYSARDIQLSLQQSREEKSGSLTEKILMYCFAYDPQTGKYTLAILNVLKAGGVMTVLMIGGMICLLRRKEGGHG